MCEGCPGALALYLSQRGSDSFACGISGAGMLLPPGTELDLPRHETFMVCGSTLSTEFLWGGDAAPGESPASRE